MKIDFLYFAHGNNIEKVEIIDPDFGHSKAVERLIEEMNKFYSDGKTVIQRVLNDPNVNVHYKEVLRDFCRRHLNECKF